MTQCLHLSTWRQRPALHPWSRARAGWAAGAGQSGRQGRGAWEAQAEECRRKAPFRWWTETQSVCHCVRSEGLASWLETEAVGVCGKRRSALVLFTSSTPRAWTRSGKGQQALRVPSVIPSAKAEIITRGKRAQCWEREGAASRKGRNNVHVWWNSLNVSRGHHLSSVLQAVMQALRPALFVNPCEADKK